MTRVRTGRTPAGRRVRPPAGYGALALAVVVALTVLPATADAVIVEQAHPESPDSAGQGEAAHQPGYAQEGFSESFGVEIVGHLPTPEGFNADVWAHGRYAFLASWGSGASEPENPDDPSSAPTYPYCLSQGVRVVDLLDPSKPRLVATFADAAGEPDVAGSWTEKVVVADVDTAAFTGTMAAVSFQNCTPEGFRGFGVYDVSDPREPRLLHLQRTEPDTRAQAGSHEIWLDTTDDGRAFVYTAEIHQELRSSGAQPGEDGAVPETAEPGEDADFRIFEVTDPSAVRLASQWGAWRQLGVPPAHRDGNGVLRTNFVHSVITEGDRAYLSYWDLGTVILDISDREQPTFVGRTAFAGDEEGNAHSAWRVDKDGRNLLVQTDEVFEPVAGASADPNGVVEDAWGYARLFDVSNAAQPREVATYELASTRDVPAPAPGFFTVHDPKVRGGLPGQANHVYFSWYAEGVVVMPLPEVADLGDAPPATITTPHAQFVPPPTADPQDFFFASDEDEDTGEPTPTRAVPNVWGTFLVEDFAGRGVYALASDINSGLWVFRLDEEVPASSCAGERSAENFDDVDADDEHVEAITCALNAGVTQGTSTAPPLFSPTQPVTRAQMAAFIVRALDAAGFPAPAPGEPQFRDVAGHPQEEAIRRLAAAGVVGGFSDGTFRPQARVRRDQTAALLLRAYEFAVGEEITPTSGPHFHDTRGNVHEAAIDAAAELGVMLGGREGRFRPDADTRRDQMAAVITRVLEQLELTGATGVPG